jgi:valyl-tRNA synthetase
MRAEVGAAPSKKSELILNFTDESLRAVFTENQSYLDKLAYSDPITILPAGADKPENAMAGMVNGVEVFLPLKGLIDVDKETARLTKELEKLDKEISRLAKKLGNEGFLAKAPADVVAGEKEKLAGYEEKKKSVEGRMQDLAKLK